MDAAEAERANRADWDAQADDYQAEHGTFLRDVGLVWCPEGLDESAAHLLGDVTALAGARMLELGCGAAQGARWLVAQGAEVVGMDQSVAMLQHSRRIDAATGVSVPVAGGTATALPLTDGVFDLACSAFGALPFLVDVEPALSEVARVLRPGGRFVFAVTHPARWMFRDDPTESGLRIERSYFDRAPYVERDRAGRVTYVEAHRTVGDWVRALSATGFALDDVVEPEWPHGHDRVWGGWGPLRGRLLPGTAIFCCTRRSELG